MTMPTLILLAVCGLAAPDEAEPDMSALVRALGSDRAAERIEAAGALEERGRPALPALHAARDSADPELRSRVAHLIDLIERQRLMRATKVQLDAHDRPLALVVESIRTRTGFDIVLEPEQDAQALGARRITLQADEPVPFWEALDRLGAAGGVRHHPGVSFRIDHRAPVVPLIADDGPPVPVSYAGPFRVNLIGLSRHRRIRPGRKPAESEASEDFQALLQVFAEPGLALSGSGPLVLEEARDDQGRDLRSGIAAAPSLRSPWHHRIDQGYLGILQYRIPLTLPATPGRQIRRLKGYAPVTVVARTSGPVVVRLNGTEGGSASAAGLTLTASKVRRQGENTLIDVTIRGETQPDEPPIPPGAFRPPLGDFLPPYRVEDHLQVLDARGRVCWWNTGPRRFGPEGERLVELTVYGRQVGPPAELRYHGIVGASTEVPFEFRDLPMP